MIPGGTSLATLRRIQSHYPYFVGHGIDVGGGHDSVAQYQSLFGFKSCKNWDMADGDAELLEGVPDNSYDFVYSSHCLEHMRDPVRALGNWFRVLKPGCSAVIAVPDEEMYEKLQWPSRFNRDHKWSFTIYRPQKRLPVSINVLDLLTQYAHVVDILKIERIEKGYDYQRHAQDQTATGSAECAIEFIVRKLP